MYAGSPGRATVRRAFRSAVGPAVGAAVSSAVRTAVRASVGSAVRTSVGPAVVNIGRAGSTPVHRTFLLVRVLLGVRHGSS
ncbi:hypothetical protein [Streptomyces sp. NBC_00691]|uniref:hypothetical protein n=1 Tax=Streptomyces sp. NBC_00691 TaxID=2903671 RepID=UPI002E34ABEF|nr:hypothetical protein [Streptomyces sp. NBC_00691]